MPCSGFNCKKGWKWALVWFIVVLLICVLIGLLLLFLLPKSLTSSIFQSQEDWNPLLLPQHSWPIDCEIRLQTFLEYNKMENPNFHGTVKILLICKKAANFLRFHALDLVFGLSNISLEELDSEGCPQRNLSLSNIAFNNYTQMATLDLSEDLQAGKKYLLSIVRYVGFIRLDAKGFYLSTYRTDIGRRRFLAATQFEVAEARRAFPCFDEPRFKANFSVTILRRITMISLSNMERIESINRGDGWFEDRFATSVKMSTYLVAFAVCDFQFKQKQSDAGVQVRAYSRPNAINEVDHVLHMSVKMLKYFEDYFGIPYALNKIDLIALPDFSHGAMENWGLVTFKETAMLYNAERDTKSQRGFVSMILGHEIAHQWFGNLVTMEWWNDLWLNEGFANYMGYVSAEAVDPTEPMEDVFILDNVRKALQLDSMATTHAILTDVSHPDEIVQLFDAITYRKGSCLIRMMSRFLGEKVLQNGLQIYLKAHSFSNTVSQDLWNALDEAVRDPKARLTRERMDGMSVSTVMDSWIKLVGYPVVSFIRSYGTSKNATLIQQRFQISGSEKDSEKKTWYIPFTYTDSVNQNWKLPSMQWVTGPSAVVSGMPDENSWVVGNVDYSGFYRVNYDSRNWQLLISQLISNHKVFSVPQRSQILEDTMAFSQAQILDVEYALNATVYLKKEDEYLPWMVSLDNLRFIDNILQGTAEYTLFRDFMRGQLRNVYRGLGWKEREQEGKLVSLLRERVLTEACHYGINDCLQRSKSAFQTWISTGNLNHVPIDLRYTVSCYGVGQGGSGEYEFLWEKYKEATSNKVHQDLIRTISCTRDPLLLKRLLFSSLNTTLIRPWHIQYLFEALSRSHPGRDVAWNFLREHWRKYYNLLNENTGNLAIVVNYFNDPNHLEQLEEFMKERVFGPSKRRFNEAKEVVKGNMRWKQKNLKTVIKWLKNYMANRSRRKTFY